MGKKKNHVSRSIQSVDQLVDGNKCGTMIIGDFRTGTHFVRDRAWQVAIDIGLRAKRYPEWIGTDNLSCKQRFKNIAAMPDHDYHVVIVNELTIKTELLKMLPALENWHLIRATRHDVHQWFMSWFFFNYLKIYDEYAQTVTPKLQAARHNGREVMFFGTANGGDYINRETRIYMLSWRPETGTYINGMKIGKTMDELQELEVRNAGHHDNLEHAYLPLLEEWMIQRDEKELLQDLSYSLLNRVISLMVPVDMEIDYAHLSGMASKDHPWRPNQYPSLSLKDIFVHHELIERMLSGWSQPWPGTWR